MNEKHSRIDIIPSDLGQSYVRIALVSVVFLLSITIATRDATPSSAPTAHLQLAFWYLLFSLVLSAWTLFLMSANHSSDSLIRATRIASIVADTGALAAYTALSHAYCILLLPLCVTSCIGYGYRFGIFYLFATLILHLVFLSIAFSHNEFVQENKILIYAYYASIILIPLYSASLLKKHRSLVEQLHELNEARSRFIANMSHELRTPLHAISSISELMEESVVDTVFSRASLRQQIQAIKESAEHLLRLVNQVLFIASAKAGRDSAHSYCEVDLHSQIISAIRICQPSAIEKKLRFDWYLDSEVLACTVDVSEQFQDVLINVIGNAIKYTDKGAVSIRISQKRKLNETDLHVEISDTGCGIPARLLPNIFEPFVMADDGAGRVRPGSGLGLTLTKHYLDALGGSISISSNVGEGTNCRIGIPLAVGASKRSNAIDHARVSCSIIGNWAPESKSISLLKDMGWDCTYVAKDLVSCAARVDSWVVFIHPRITLSKDELESFRNACPHAIIIQLFENENSEIALSPAINLSLNLHNALDLIDARKFCAKLLPGRTTAGHFDHESRRILIVDDNATNRNTARFALEGAGHVVTLAADGGEALIELEANHYDIAFIDMHMPGISGIEVVKIYQYFEANTVPIVLLTADATDGARLAAVEAGATAFLTKPVGARGLRDARGSSRNGAPDMGLIAGDYELHECGLFGSRTSNCNGSEVLALIDEFENDARRMIASFIFECEGGRISGALEILHSLYGAAGVVGATTLANLVKITRAKTSKELLNEFNLCGASMEQSLTIDIQRIKKLLTNQSPI
jgi:two-component system, sensor histidine kinase RpfC